jgi:glycosyltransferase involved in cell wall biosynthesis
MIDVRYGAAATPAPRVSVVTTVYDRSACLQRCIGAMRHSRYRNFEHVIVSDAPGPATEAAILAMVRAADDPARLRYLALSARANDWGITPAAVGLRAAVGEFVCFLSDDNAYMPEHLGTLVAALDADPALGFAYSSCRYAGRRELRTAPPAFARIDLGQPLFRRALFRAHLADDLPFAEYAWDWRLIDAFLQRGVRWRHIDVPSFVFRLAAYPTLVEALA